MSHSNSFSTINEINEKFDYIIIISKMLKNIENELILENNLEKKTNSKLIYNSFFQLKKLYQKLCHYNH
jgi:hypothetical protein